MNSTPSVNWPPRARLHPLPPLGLIRAGGADAAVFLQGQLTQDVRRIDAATTLRAACCTPKGRVLATLRLYARDQALWLWLPAERAQALVKRLKMYVLRARVELQDESASQAGFGLVGAADALEAALGVAVPRSADRALAHGGLSVLCLPGPQLRHAVLGETAAVEALRQQLLAAGVEAGSADGWVALDIAAGIAEVHGPLVEAFVPQMLDLDRSDGISFSKGCYTGQEIVARVHYLGQIRQRLYRLHVAAEHAPQLAQSLGSLHAAANESAGQIVSVAADPQGGWQALAVVPTRLAELGDLQLEDGTPVTLSPVSTAAS